MKSFFSSLGASILGLGVLGVGTAVAGPAVALGVGGAAVKGYLKDKESKQEKRRQNKAISNEIDTQLARLNSENLGIERSSISSLYSEDLSRISREYGQTRLNTVKNFGSGVGDILAPAIGSALFNGGITSIFKGFVR